MPRPNPVRTLRISASRAVNARDYDQVLADATAAAIIVTLISPSGGGEFIVKVQNSGDGSFGVTVAAAGGKTINGSSTYSLAGPNQAAIFEISDKGNFHVFAGAESGTGVTTGSGSLVRATSPTLVTPALGAASATSLANGAGAVGAPSFTFTGQTDLGFYKVSATQLGLVVGGALVAVIDASGLAADSTRNRVNLGAAGAGTVSVKEYGDGRDITTVLTLTNFIVGALAGAAAALGVGNKVYTFPAGAHMLEVSYISLGFTAAGTTNTPKVGLGSVIASGAVAVLNGTATFMDYITEQTAADLAGTALKKAAVATAGALLGIANNAVGDVKDVFLNVAATWAANNTGNLTASGTITFKWTLLS